MGSTSFSGFSCPNMLLVFSELVFFLVTSFIFFASIGTFSGSFIFLYLISG